MPVTLKPGYVKDEDGELISPITSSETILMPNGWNLEETLLNQRLAIIQYICDQVKALPDEEIHKYEAIFPDWTVGITLLSGDIVRYKNKLYRVFEPHIAQVDKPPDGDDMSDVYSVIHLDNELTSYTIELNRWGIDGEPTNNSNGINNALAWASQEGYSEVIFPTMEYVIDELIPISIQNMNDVTINLNGSILRINPNGLLVNRIIIMKYCVNFKLINGTIMGDIYTHDYETNPGTTEGNQGILLTEGCLNCQLENLLIKDITGWGILTSIGNPITKKRATYSISVYNLEQGRIDLNTGEKITDSSKIRTINSINTEIFHTSLYNYFTVGWDIAHMGNPYLSTRNFDIAFYDSNGDFISGLSNQMTYKKIFFPSNMTSVAFTLYQPDVPTEGDILYNKAVLFMNQYLQPRNIEICNCVIDNCRSLAMAICAGDNMTIRNCTLKNTGTLAPGYAVDLEDGWELMDNISLINNTFENNGNGDLVVCAGDNFLFKGNKCTGHTGVYARATNYTFEDNIFTGRRTSSGMTRVSYGYSTDMKCTGNVYKNMSIRTEARREGLEIVLDKEVLINTGVIVSGDGITRVTNSPITANVGDVINNQFLLNGDYENCIIKVEGDTIGGHYCTISNANVYNSELTGCGMLHTNNVVYDNCIFSNSFLRTHSSVLDLTISDCDIIDTNLIVSIGNAPVNFDIHNNRINMINMKDSLVKISASRMRGLIFKDNTVINQIAKPVFDMNDTTYSTPDGNIVLSGNVLEQSKHLYIFSGVNINRGVVYFFSNDNTITGTAQLLDPKYLDNQYFIISS